MVMRYYGNKDKLFAAAAEFDLQFPDFAETDPAQMGRSLVRHFLERWEGDEALVILLRSSATNVEAAQRMQEIFGTQLQPLVAWLVPASRSRRCGPGLMPRRSWVWRCAASCYGCRPSSR